MKEKVSSRSGQQKDQRSLSVVIKPIKPSPLSDQLFLILNFFLVTHPILVFLSALPAFHVGPFLVVTQSVEFKMK